MGFFSRIWKGLKNGVKKIGQAIKKGVASVGKFMDKAGIVGQIGLMFILPGLGGMLAKGVGALAGASNPILAGVGKILTTAGKFASTAGNAFRTVSDGITSFVSNIGKGFVNQVASTFGKEGLVFKSGQSTVQEGFKKWMSGVADDVRNIPSPFKKVADTVTSDVESLYSKTFAAPDTPYEMIEKAFKVPDYSKEFKIPDIEVLNNDSPFTLDIRNPSQASSIITSENQAANGFWGKVKDFAVKNVEAAPQRAVDTFSDTFTSGLASGAINKIGLGPEPPTYVQNVTNVPKFDSTPITQTYEKNGFGYGALPDNRIQFYAAQNYGGDYGLGSFNRFAQLRTA